MQKLITKDAQTIVPIAPLIASRWSPRVFDSQHELSDGDLLALGEAARWAPSSNNAQPWKLAFLKRGTPEFEVLSKQGLTGFNQTWAPSASVYAVVLADQVKPDGSDWDKAISFYNAGLMSAQVVFQAEHMGLKAHYMGGIVHDVVASQLGITKQWVVNVIALGKQASDEHSSDDLKQRERAERVRKPLEEIVIHGIS